MKRLLRDASSLQHLTWDEVKRSGVKRTLKSLFPFVKSMELRIVIIALGHVSMIYHLIMSLPRPCIMSLSSMELRRV
jgi:hypothetical protein